MASAIAGSAQDHAGTRAVVRIDRLNIAERLYRVTGEGIYHDSVFSGPAGAAAKPGPQRPSSARFSVDTCVYHGRLFWLWGDGRDRHPLAI